MLNKYFELNVVSYIGMMWLIVNAGSNLDFLWVAIPFAVLFFGGWFIHAHKGRSSEFKNYKDEGK